MGRTPSNSEVTALELGQARGDFHGQSLGMLGAKRTEVGEDGKFETLAYKQIRVGFTTTEARIVLLEFRNDRLNGFHQLSELRGEKVPVDLRKVETVRAGIGTFGRDDVLATMGKPHGKALNPTHVASYRAHCATNVTEIWGWSHAKHQSSGFLTSTDVLIGFDAAGKVVKAAVQDRAYEMLRGQGMRPFAWDE
jgi:hypothetical protein